MGGFWSRAFSTGPPYRIFMSGLDCAGKSSILYGLKLGEVVSTVAFIGTGSETVAGNKVIFTAMDIGGRSQSRALLYHHYYKQSHAVIFVVDSSDQLRLDEAKYELLQMLEYESFADVPVLILANKQDLPTALTPEEVSKQMDLNSIKQHWAIFPTVACGRKGIFEALDWLSDALVARDVKKRLVEPVADTVDDVYTSVSKTTEKLTDLLYKPGRHLKKWVSPS